MTTQPPAPDDQPTLQPAEGGSPWKACYSCRDYAEYRREVLAQPLADKARREGRDVIEVVDEFMYAAHERHMSGKPLREGGPTRLTDPAIGRLAALLSPGLFGTSDEASA